MTTDDVVRIARTWIGTPYKHQASIKGVGSDCLGFIRGVWRELYGSEAQTIIPAYTRNWAGEAGDEMLLAAANKYMVRMDPVPRRGDILPNGHVIIVRVVPYGPAQHGCITIAPNQIIHAYSGNGVKLNYIAESWMDRIEGLYAFPGVDD